jgi:CheY-like chemotaxis protein
VTLQGAQKVAAIIDAHVPAKCAIWTRRKCHRTGTPRVLIVDDYVDTADAVGMVLSMEGFPTEVAYGGHTAIAAAQRWLPDVIVLDIWMPDLSGLQVAKYLRAYVPTSHAIIIGYSALSALEDLDRAQQAGFDAYCTKPIDAARLSSFLLYLCHVVRPS